MQDVEFSETNSNTALSERKADFVGKRNGRTDKMWSYSLYSGQDAPEHSECTGNCSYEGCTCPTERRLTTLGHILQAVSAIAGQETKSQQNC